LKKARFCRLRAQLALAFVVVALAAVLATVAVGNLSVRGDEQQDMTRQQVMQTNTAAVGAASAYARRGWARDLTPVMAEIAGSGSAAQIRDSHGHIVRSSANFASFAASSEHRTPVTVNGRTVGSVTMRFGEVGANAVLARFNSQRLRARIIGVSIGVLIAMLAAFVVALRITGPLTKLLKTARARGGGRPDARVGPVHGFRDMRELGTAFDQMADTLSRQDQVRRNLVADVAHQLRTPIAVIRAGSEAMLDGISKPTPANIESLHEETIRLTRMVDDLQVLSAAEAAAVQLTLKPSDLSAAAAAAADSLADVYRRAGVRLVRQLSPVTVPCDEPRMHDVIINLLGNAAKFTPAGGWVELNTHPNGKAAILRVRDSGIGIAAEELPYVSERFYRAANSAAHDGSGIGLAIVDELVRGHHGTLDIESQTGQGTEVTVKLPKA
jgi:two-component system, OmpR family, sensor histidine kinase BaeS